uniref:TPR_REGION domain-containing protein n=1 Tax=Anopheles epiroticus TaxID=199890 RepID=A0A182PDC6_9DIPT
METPVAYLNLGTSLIALGRCQEAASVLREGTKLDGAGLRDRAAHENARISALLQLGNLYADQGKLQRALAVYREALHTLPERYPPQVSTTSLHRIIYIEFLRFTWLGLANDLV